MTTLHIAIERDASGFPPFDAEEVDAVRLGDGRFRLATPPVFTKDLAVGDVVLAQTHDGVPWIVSVEAQGDHGTVTVITLGDLDTSGMEALAAQVEATTRSGAVPGMIVFDVSPTTNLAGLLSQLAAGAHDGTLDYQVGCYPAWWQGDR